MNDQTHLQELMRRSVGDAGPDLDRLVGGALRDGTRIRRRRRMAGAGAGLAVAAVTAVAVGVLGSGSGTRAVDPASGTASDAASPSPTPQRQGYYEGRTYDFGGGITGTVVRCGEGPIDPDLGRPTCALPSEYTIEQSNTLEGSGEGWAVVLTGPADAINDFWGAGFDDPRLQSGGLAIAIRADSPLIAPVNQGQRVSIDVPGWTLSPEIVDDKQELSGPDGAVADIVWRRASDYAGWTAGDDKADGAFVSDVHDGVFVTIQGGQGTTRADLDALGASLRWE